MIINSCDVIIKVKRKRIRARLNAQKLYARNKRKVKTNVSPTVTEPVSSTILNSISELSAEYSTINSIDALINDAVDKMDEIFTETSPEIEFWNDIKIINNDFDTTFLTHNNSDRNDELEYDMLDEYYANFDNIHIDDDLEIPEAVPSNQTLNECSSKNFDGIRFPIFEFGLEKSSIKHMKKFDKICGNIKWNTCSKCNRSFPHLLVKNNVCTNCIKYPNRWTCANSMCPGTVPPELACLTDIE